MLRKIILPFLILLYFSSGFSQTLKQDPVLTKKTLQNGLTYYIYPTDKVNNQAYFRLFLKVGALQEEDGQRGLAHFMEHMAFNGIEHFKENELTNFLESKGAKFGHDMNAHTSYDETIFKLKLPTDDPVVIDSTITILADWADGILLDSIEVEKERGVVLSEWRNKQNTSQKSQEDFLNSLLNKSRYAERRVIGDTAVLKNFNHKELKDFYEKWYDPSLMAVAIAGDVDPEQIENLIIEKFSDMETTVPNPTEYEIPDYQENDFKISIDKGVKKTELNIFHLIPPLVNVGEERVYKEYLQRSLLNKLIAERFAILSFKDPAYNDASISIGNFFPSKGVILSRVELDPDSISAGINEFIEKSEQIYRYGFTSFEIEKIKSTYLSNFKNELEKEKAPSAATMIAEMHHDFFSNNTIVTTEEEYRLAKKYMPELDSISLAKAVAAYHGKGFEHLLLQSNEETKEKIPASAELTKNIGEIMKKEIPRYENKVVVPKKLLEEKPEMGTLVSKTEIPEIESTSLKFANGVHVIYKQSDIDKDNIIVSGFREGGLYALDSTDYVSGMYALPVVSLSGYGAFTREALSQFLTGKNVRTIMLADKTRTGFYANSNMDHAELMFQLLYLKWTQPRVDKDLYNVVKKRSIQNIKNKNPDAAEIFGKELKYVLRAKDYVTEELSPEDLEEKLELEKIKKTYDHFFGAANDYTISIISDRDLEQVMPLIQQYIGGLPSGKVDLDYKYKKSSTLVEKNTDFIRSTGETPKATVSLIFQQAKPEKDYQTAKLKNTVIKNLIKTRLLSRLREDLGAVYGISVSVSATQHPTVLSRQSISFSCERERAEELIGETQKILKELASQKNDFSPDLEKIKTNLLKTHEILKQRNSYWTKSIRDFYFDHYETWDFINNYPQQVNQISEEKIADKIHEYFIETPVIKAVLYPKENKN